MTSVQDVYSFLSQKYDKSLFRIRIIEKDKLCLSLFTFLEKPIQTETLQEVFLDLTNTNAFQFTKEMRLNLGQVKTTQAWRILESCLNKTNLQGIAELCLYEITAKFLKHLATNQICTMPYLRHLTLTFLDDSGITDEALITFFNTFQQKDPKLHELKIIHKGTQGITNYFLDVLSHMFKKKSTALALQVLTLNFTKCPFITRHAVDNLIAGLHQNCPNLTHYYMTFPFKSYFYNADETLSPFDAASSDEYDDINQPPLINTNIHVSIESQSKSDSEFDDPNHVLLGVHEPLLLSENQINIEYEHCNFKKEESLDNLRTEIAKEASQALHKKSAEVFTRLKDLIQNKENQFNAKIDNIISEVTSQTIYLSPTETLKNAQMSVLTELQRFDFRLVRAIDCNSPQQKKSFECDF